MLLSRFALLSAVAFLGLPAFADEHPAAPKPASRTAWYLLDAPRDRCVLAAEAARATGIEISSPEAFANLVRSEGRAPAVKVTRDDSGKIIEADVVDRGSVLSWFPTIELCLKGKAAGEASGELVPPGELR